MRRNGGLRLRWSRARRQKKDQVFFERAVEDQNVAAEVASIATSSAGEQTTFPSGTTELQHLASLLQRSKLATQRGIAFEAVDDLGAVRDDGALYLVASHSSPTNLALMRRQGARRIAGQIVSPDGSSFHRVHLTRADR